MSIANTKGPIIAWSNDTDPSLIGPHDAVELGPERLEDIVRFNNDGKQLGKSNSVHKTESKIEGRINDTIKKHGICGIIFCFCCIPHGDINACVCLFGGGALLLGIIICLIIIFAVPSN
jgi:hypothetical protein